MEQRELREWENKCIQEHPPACTATCPVHVDVRSFTAAVAKEDFHAATTILQKKIPFPRIVVNICDRPCENHCKRQQAGEPLSIGELEKFCVNNDYLTAPKATPLPKRNKRVAVIGGGLSGLTAAYDLAKKGYAVVIFEALAVLGGKVWSYLGNVLTEQMINADLAVLNKMNIDLRLNTSLGKDVFLPELINEYDAIYLGLGNQKALALDLQVDDFTLATQHAGVFAGGSMIDAGSRYSSILSVAWGRKAATSIDRHIQRVSLTAGRTNEGPYQTRLYTNTKGITPLPKVPMKDMDGYNKAEAVAEARRCLQCQCLECVKGCAFLDHYNGYPKKYVREIYNNESIVMGLHYANKMINSCNLCGLCATVCPNDFDMGTLCRNARYNMVQRGKMPPSAFDFPLRDLKFNNSKKFALNRNQPGMETSKYALFPGCQLSASSPEQVIKVYGYLQQKLTGGVGMMLRCCGVPADWAGEQQLFQTLLKEIEDQWQALGCPQIIAACPTCYKTIKENLPQVKLLSLWEVLDQIGLPEQNKNGNLLKLALHDPCATREQPQIHQSVRNLAEKLGCEIEELAYNREQTKCCGYGGLMYASNPPLTNKVIDSCINESNSDYLTYCAMCRDFFISQGKKTYHLLDLIYPENIDDNNEAVDYSMRRENRTLLKQKLLAIYWGEKMEQMASYEKIKLYIDEDVQQLIRQRFILKEDIQKTIESAEKSGEKFINPDTGRFLAGHRNENITYWVEYAANNDGFRIYNAYCHRMHLG
ncbi:FAD-dependent oxidoreductase [Peptococcaceae bacterium 1198_IL3148]